MYSILIVEDDSMQRKILKKLLLEINNFFRIYEADSEEDGLTIIKNNHINMFLIDITLRDSSGLELALKIRRIPKYEFKAIIFITTNIYYMAEALKKTHCYDYIIKPYDTFEVQEMIKKLISNDMNNNKYIEEKNYQCNENNQEIIIPIKKDIKISLKIKDILFVEVKGRDSVINMTNDMSYIANHISLSKLLKLIKVKNIIQSHKGFAVNINHIKKIKKIDSKLSMIYFENSDKTCLLGYKYKENIILEFEKGKIILC